MLGWLSAASIREQWQSMEIPSWLGSLIVHVMALLILTMFFVEPPTPAAEADLDSRLAQIPEEPKLDKIELEPLPLEPMQTIEIPAPEAPTAMSAVADVQTSEPATLSPVDMPALDNVSSLLEGSNPASSAAMGKGSSFSSRGAAKSAMLGSQGGTRQTEQSVHAGLAWLARHQFPDGHWSLDHTPRCSKAGCSGKGSVKSEMAATALGVLPYLAANYTQNSGPFRENVGRALVWMVQNQQPDGLLAAKGDAQPMYTHGLATIALCEGYGLTRDNRLGAAAQRAVRFLEARQNKMNGWRYGPTSEDADTSVFGWQLMGLKSAQMAGLAVQPTTIERCRKYLASASSGSKNGLFGYEPKGGATPTMTAVGLLCQQYLGAVRTDGSIQEGVAYLLRSTPSAGQRNSYLWYYATQVIHNYQGPDWDNWNRAMRQIWVETQVREKDSCAFGSWDPAKPSKDPWGDAGGRQMVTCVGLLTLEVYYRYLPLYQVMEGETKATAKK